MSAKTPSFVGPWAEHLTQYVDLMLELGRAFRNEIALLRSFDRFALERGHVGALTREMVLAFVYAPADCTKSQAQRRHFVLRRFAQYLQFFDPATQVPEPLEPAVQPARRTPHIYTENEIRRLLEAALGLPPIDALYPLTIYTVLGLLFSTGMRDGEALALDIEDVDFTNGVLLIRRTKFRKSRLVPVHATTQEALREYDRRRRARFPKSGGPAFFVNSLGRRLKYGTLYEVFLQLLRATGIRAAQGDGPRAHDIRHTFAVRRVQAWYDAGEDVQQMLPLLATYLGHLGFENTSYYLTASAELLNCGAQRFTHEGRLQP
jgi:integrase